jgi:hypothetical protein
LFIYGEKGNVYRIVAGKCDEMRFLGRPLSTSDYNIEVDLKELGWNNASYFYLA